MCCLFGIIDYGKSLTPVQRSRMLSILADECEARGTDATGIAYNSKGKLRIYKRPRPAHEMRFLLPQDASVVMGHTRMTTQGKASKNINNHPFPGNTGSQSFALAHNGVLYNDMQLRKSLRLPRTRIETDSFVAVQLIEQKRVLNFDSLKYMAEQVEGSFSFTVLDERNTLYLVKGENPLCVYHYPKKGIYIYASTEEILHRAVWQMWELHGRPIPVSIACGDILQIQPNGQISSSTFNTDCLLPKWFYPRSYSMCNPSYKSSHTFNDNAEQEYISELQQIAPSFGYTAEEVHGLIREGFSPEEIEEWLYDGEF